MRRIIIWDTLADFDEHVRETTLGFAKPGYGDQFDMFYFVEYTSLIHGRLFRVTFQTQDIFGDGSAEWTRIDTAETISEQFIVKSKFIRDIWDRIIDLRGHGIPYWPERSEHRFSPDTHHYFATIFNDEGKLIYQTRQAKTANDQEVEEIVKEIQSTIPASLQTVTE